MITSHGEQDFKSKYGEQSTKNREYGVYKRQNAHHILTTSPFLSTFQILTIFLVLLSTKMGRMFGEQVFYSRKYFQILKESLV